MTVQGERHAQLVVLGSGPGGYSAAFRAADLGLQVILVERYTCLGGVCLNVGCIPSKALLHVAKVIADAAQASEFGLDWAPPDIDLQRTRRWKDGIVDRLTRGLAGLAGKRGVTIVQGSGKFTGPNRMEVESQDRTETLSFDQAIIAVGSRATRIPGTLSGHERVMDSTGALTLEDIPEKLLVIGGGIIGLEMATVYHALGSKVSVAEITDRLIAGADADLLRPLTQRIRKQYEQIWLNTRVTGMESLGNRIKVHFAGKEAPQDGIFDRVLVATGRAPNGNRIDVQRCGVFVDERGFIPVDEQQRTSAPHIFAVGDVVGQPMLAHKAVHEGKAAAEAAAGMKSGFEARVIPNVAYTDPEIAWAGITEADAKAKGLEYGKGVFPWAASGRSLCLGRSEGLTKLLFDRTSGRIIGAGISGSHAGDLIAEAVLAIEMNADARDIGLSVHAHPTLSETLGFAAEVFEGTITDLYLPGRSGK